MKPAIINADKKTISCKPVALNVAHAWASISTVKLCSMPTLFDEIGMICQVGDQQLFVRETEEGFTAVIDFLKFTCEFPEDWYQQVEQGEELVLAPQAT